MGFCKVVQIVCDECGDNDATAPDEDEEWAWQFFESEGWTKVTVEGQPRMSMYTDEEVQPGELFHVCPDCFRAGRQ